MAPYFTSRAELERRMDAARQLRSETLSAGAASMISALAAVFRAARDLMLESVAGRSRVAWPTGESQRLARSEQRQTGASGPG